MRFSENRRLAWIVLAICVIIAVFPLGAGSLMSARRDLVELFTNGSESTSPTRYSMDAYLDKCAESATLLAESASLYIDDTELIEDVRKLAADLNALNGPDGRYAIYQQLVQKVNSLYTALEAAGKTSETDILLSYGDFKGAMDRLERDEEYRKQAQVFNEDLGSFPANLIGGVFGVKQLDTYGW